MDDASGIKVDNDAMDVPAAAIGVLHFMELTLGEIDFYRSTSCIAAAPVFLKLLSQIAAKHATMVVPFGRWLVQFGVSQSFEFLLYRCMYD
eukprot:scaffold110071_cov37-Prasinocladus_malaysianus.AAC.1